MLTIWINTVLSAALFYTCFCRLVRTDHGTVAGVRLGFCALAGAALLNGCAPFLWGYLPPAHVLAVLAAITLVQGITARHWKHGVPCHFRKDQQ